MFFVSDWNLILFIIILEYYLLYVLWFVIGDDIISSIGVGEFEIILVFVVIVRYFGIDFIFEGKVVRNRCGLVIIVYGVFMLGNEEYFGVKLEYFLDLNWFCIYCIFIVFLCF